MDKDVTILGKFYLKNGNIIEERVVLDKENSREDIDNFIKDTKQTVKVAFRYNIDFNLTFGFTILRGSELVAVAIKEEK